jgi:hypothetical protein
MSSGMRRFSYQILLQLQRTHLSPMLLVIVPFLHSSTSDYSSSLSMANRSQTQSR